MFKRSHFSVIVFVIVSQKVQRSMENQPADFARRRVAIRSGVPPRRFSGNQNVAQKVRKFRPLKTTFRSASLLSRHFMPRREYGGNLSRTLPCLLTLSLPGKREDVGRPRVASINRIQRGHLPV